MSKTFEDSLRRVMHHQTLGGFPFSSMQENEDKAVAAILEAHRLAAALQSLKDKTELLKELLAIYTAKYDTEPMFDFQAVLEGQIEAFEAEHDKTRKAA